MASLEKPKEINNNNNNNIEMKSPSSSSNNKALSRYESQKKRDWNTFGQYLKNQNPTVPLSHCDFNHVLEFLKYLDQFGKTKVHVHGCVYFGEAEPRGACPCPLRQAWGSLDALIGRLRAAFDEHRSDAETTNPFASGAIRLYLREVKDSQSKARGVLYKKKKKKKRARSSFSSSSSIAGVDDPDHLLTRNA